MTKNRKGVASRIAQETANLRERPREAEAGIDILLRSDWSAVAKAALTVGDNDEALKQLFADADLDVRNPVHWALLVRLLANLRLKSRRGAPLQWEPMELCQLLTDVDRVHHGSPGLSIERICQKLVKEPRYKEVKSASTLRRLFYRALDPKTNPLVGRVLEGRNENDWLRSRRKAGWRMKGAVSVREIMLDEIIETLMTSWRKKPARDGAPISAQKNFPVRF
jgi:hypothetical protein